MFPKIEENQQNGWFVYNMFLMENRIKSIKMDDFGGKSHHFRKPPHGLGSMFSQKTPQKVCTLAGSRSSDRCHPEYDLENDPRAFFKKNGGEGMGKRNTM